MVFLKSAKTALGKRNRGDQDFMLLLKLMKEEYFV